ncbi:hypothetical protein NL108_002652 [Boleophthalmus pectinirostris]|nr:hypothetical protein NL108_002652 [Boleophthalmus pectinirostris]
MKPGFNFAPITASLNELHLTGAECCGLYTDYSINKYIITASSAFLPCTDPLAPVQSCCHDKDRAQTAVNQPTPYSPSSPLSSSLSFSAHFSMIFHARVTL